MLALPYIVQLLNALLSLVPEGTALWNKYNGDKTLLQQMIDEKREPTPQEWDTLNATTAGLEAQIDAAANARGG